MRWLTSLPLAGLGLGLLLAYGCGAPPGGPCNGNGNCVCVQGEVCTFDCPTQHDCDVTCNGVSSCEGDCVDRCDLACVNGSVCDLSCQHDCRSTCDSVSTCDTTCGDRCDYECVDTSVCRAHMGPDSTARCERVSACDVECDGACTLICIATSTCHLTCSAGDSIDCGDGRKVCAPTAC
ncbi:MAG: hypothetical protein IPO88_26940 [Nannocystis sp.]|uniref:hypothetical protein n=1 Tax=Nannocystis sp. TaxID=1962667 RepID=UPI002428D69F|nr:hypothetical protein [Nannocystis sp.]MBK9757066.1 hypothetical protein [Nannocystis sp.]